jgi:hypothetical protein
LRSARAARELRCELEVDISVLEPLVVPIELLVPDLLELVSVDVVPLP